MSVLFRSINPKNNKLYRTFEAVSNKDLEAQIDRSYQRFRYKYAQGHTRIERRFEKLGYLSQILLDNKSRYAELMTQEMGKPIVQAEAEIDKCIAHLKYYIENTDRFIQDEELDIINPNQSGVITHQPLGPTLVIMPWNFPFWLPFKSIIPPMIMGNSIMLKHSPSTPLCAMAIQEAMTEAGFGKGEF